MIYGYARVSTDGQSVYAQVKWLRGAGAEKVFLETASTWAAAATAHGRLMLTVLGGLAEFERELIRTRTGEGRARAVANGVKLGRKPALTHHQRTEAMKRIKAGKETLGEIARSYNVSRWTIQRLLTRAPCE
jgi:DNA invertase Pin-like site-specific DNA recombinase